VDPEGRLVGINTAILSRTGGNHGVGFAIPANLARSVMDQLVLDGRVERGFLGVSIQDLTPELAEEFDIKSEGGALVAEVSEDSAAKTAGLKRGDVLVEVNGKPVRDSRSLRLLIGDLRPGTEAKLNYIREGKQRTATARLKAAPGNLARRLPEGDREGGPADEGALRGVRVGTITEEVRRQHSVPPEVEGVAVLEVDPESASFQAGLRPGDVLLEINRHRVRSAEEAIEACRNSRGGRTLVNFWRQGGHRYVVVKENLEE
jgi:serine protease Do